jgi:uncharacterized lipoprotein YddW (UPF0748 family)
MRLILFFFLTVNFIYSQGDNATVPNEFRAVWVASVANISWPSQPGLDSETQKEEAIQIIENAKKGNLNTIILQVRPQSDALYESMIEPWSYFLTGESGLPPNPYYDPLSFWIEECHKRGIKLHAWLNPYRASHPTNKSINETSSINRYSDIALELKNGYWWYDPSLEQVKKLSLDVVRDIVSRYNVDGIHFDDYFYPYPSYNDNEEFPDHISWENSKKSILINDRKNWRRKSVNTFIKSVYKEIKKIKPEVLFGISPFGIWRPGNPKSATTTFDQYDMLFADARKWIRRGWADYFSPQLYWTIANEKYSFPVMLDWWESNNKKNRYLWPGIRLSNYKGEQQIKEVSNQIMIMRSIVKKNPGIVFWSYNDLKNNPGIFEILSNQYFK